MFYELFPLNAAFLTPTELSKKLFKYITTKIYVFFQTSSPKPKITRRKPKSTLKCQYAGGKWNLAASLPEGKTRRAKVKVERQHQQPRQRH